MNYKEIWKKTEEDLKTSLPAHAYEAWIETLSPVGVTNQIFILEAPNQFAYDWIINNYHDIILSSLLCNEANLDCQYLEYSIVLHFSILKSQDLFFLKKVVIARSIPSSDVPDIIPNTRYFTFLFIGR